MPSEERENVRSSKNGLNIKRSMQNIVAGAAEGADGNHEFNQKLYENTYKLAPDVKFNSEAVKRLLHQVMEAELKEAVYDAQKTPEMCKDLSDKIVHAVSKMGYDRYKFVVEMTIGESKGQGARAASRCLWDTKTDSYASANFKNVCYHARPCPQLTLDPSPHYLPLVLCLHVILNNV